MTTAAPAAGVAPDEPDPRMFPVLTPAQLARLAGRAPRREVADGEVLVRPGEPAAALFVVAAGRLRILRPRLAEGSA